MAWPALTMRLETLKSFHCPALLHCLEINIFRLNNEAAQFHLSKYNDHFLLDSKTKFYFPSYLSADGRRTEWECCWTYDGGGRGCLAWKSLLGTHFFVLFINLCHSESALITTGTIIVICQQALILLIISLCTVIIWEPLSAAASGLQHLFNSKFSQCWERQHLFSQKELSKRTACNYLKHAVTRGLAGLVHMP